MATLKQIAANRRNAEKSTGPRTEAGKAASRFNALKSGIDAKFDVIPCEEPADLKRLIAEYLDRFQPTTPEARFLVDTLIANDWLLRRLRNAEVAIWEHEIDETFKRHDHAVALAAENQSDVFERIQRRMNAAQRNYQRALTELQRLPVNPPAHALTLVSATVSTADPKPEPIPIGFVPPPDHSARRAFERHHGPDQRSITVQSGTAGGPAEPRP